MSRQQSVPSDPELQPSGQILSDACLCCVDQCLAVVDALKRPNFVLMEPGASSIGTHMRHIIDRFSCVLQGVSGGRIDYDSRARDRRLENDSAVARAALVTIREQLRALELGSSRNLSVTESIHQDRPAMCVSSTLERELMSLVSHTIHHLAIIVLLARNRGQELDAEIGKAPSTIIFERRTRR